MIKMDLETTEKIWRMNICGHKRTIKRAIIVQIAIALVINTILVGRRFFNRLQNSLPNFK